MREGLRALMLVLAAGPKPTVPQNVEQLYADFDPRRDPLEVEVVRQWGQQGAVLRHVLYTVATFNAPLA